MRQEKIVTDLCVIGGGPAGFCTALSAARTGIHVVLMQNRPMLGGNSSSEIRMSISVVPDASRRETGILEEIQLDNFYYNSGLKFSLWDNVLYSKILQEPNIKLLLNCNCMQASYEGRKIESVSGWQMTTETWYTVEAKYFADCSGDGILAPLTGAAFMLGREDKQTFGEPLGQEVADDGVMGMSILIQFRETLQKQIFIPPVWAYRFTDEKELEGKIHTLNQNFWWIEYGGELDVLHENDRIQEELLKIAYGIVDHLKNQGDHGLDNWELEWVGCIPGRRESRRYVGKHIVTQNEVEAGGLFEDVVAYAWWTMDNHFPAGFYHPGRIAVNYPTPKTWGIPLRSLIARDFENLVFAGRNLSASHLAFSSARVMASCSLMGQALGTAVAMVVQENKSLENIDIEALQQKLMFDDCFIPGKQRKLSEIAKKPHTNAEIVRNGIDRCQENCWIGKKGECITYTFDSAEEIKGVRLIFDSDLDRHYNNMPSCYPLVEERFKLPKTLIKEYDLIYKDAQGKSHTIHVEDNHQRLVFHMIDSAVTEVSLIPREAWDCESMRIFDFEVF